ncbi:hypothetical protein NC653_002856 [Populus alba x Populus x berolinensis]|uniref:Uncharacterized protein n=1 Tax=Populus alba x Populus x berolinensis TaxID=444605 RepID=A0AAD6RPY3_9ROSI|nr:hypothetical protein NC653_002856 [Populus alba x Populus x berolinensis]
MDSDNDFTFCQLPFVFHEINFDYPESLDSPTRGLFPWDEVLNNTTNRWDPCGSVIKGRVYYLSPSLKFSSGRYHDY